MDKISRAAYGLTDETRKVINGKAARIADELGWNDKTVYKITYDELPDPFAYFIAFYKACVRAGADISHYDLRMNEAKARYNYTEKGDNAACLAEKILRDADTTAKMVDALKDGSIDASEAESIRKAIQKERDNLDLLEMCLGFSNVREFSKGAVAKRR